MVLNTVLEPVLRPLLNALGPFGALLAVSVFVSLLTTLVYKFATDQDTLRSLKADLKRYQKKLTAASKTNPEKAMKIQKDVMRVNGQYMKHSMKSTLYTFIPIILFFGWLQANLAFAPLLPGELFEVSVTLPEGVNEPATLVLADGLTSPDVLTQNASNGQVNWSIQGPEGIYDSSIIISGEEQFFSFIISENVAYEEPLNTFEDSTYFSSITVGNDKLLLFEGIPLLGSIPWIKTFGWFGAYFLFSIIFSTSLRKLFKLA
jgi:uncharacterized membrane protein (DUF106 family)